MELIFSLSSLLVMPFWLLMIFAPRWNWTVKLLKSPLIVLPAALLYAGLVVPQMLELLPILAGPNLTSLMALLSTPQGTTVAWVHFLAFDLFVGRWIYLDNLEQKFHVALLGLILFFVLMFGPLGLVLYLGFRWFFGKTIA